MHRSRSLSVLLALTALLVPGSASAQSVTLGLHAGSNFSTFGGDDAEGLDGRRSGLFAGATVGVDLGGLLAFETGVAFARKGAEGTLVGFEEPVPVALDLDYLQIPLLMRFELPAPGRLRPTLFAGPSVGFEVGCAVDVGNSEFASTVGCDEGEDGDLREQLDWSVVFGGGLAYDLGRTSIRIDGRADHGLRNVYALDDFEVKNRTFTVTAGLTTRIGR